MTYALLHLECTQMRVSAKFELMCVKERLNSRSFRFYEGDCADINIAQLKTSRKDNISGTSKLLLKSILKKLI